MSRTHSRRTVLRHSSKFLTNSLVLCHSRKFVGNRYYSARYFKAWAERNQRAIINQEQVRGRLQGAKMLETASYVAIAASFGYRVSRNKTMALLELHKTDSHFYSLFLRTKAHIGSLFFSCSQHCDAFDGMREDISDDVKSDAVVNRIKDKKSTCSIYSESDNASEHMLNTL